MSIHTDKTMVEETVHKYTAFASDLGWRPGEWPERVTTYKGNGQPFVRANAFMRNGELLYVSYRQFLGCIELVVFND